MALERAHPGIERTVAWRDGRLRFLDQRALPGSKVELAAATAEEVAVAIESMQVRGAPLIGICAAYGVALAARASVRLAPAPFKAAVEAAAERIRLTRPTAVNLFWALDRVRKVLAAHPDPAAAAEALLAEAHAILEEDVAMNVRMGDFGAALLSALGTPPAPVTLMTHCNAGALATGGYGTALGVVRSLHRLGRLKAVYVDETRPLLQGARITAFELHEAGIPYRVVTDNMAAHVLSHGLVDAIVTGADRIAANGDTANKIGTHGLAVIAKEYGVPFHIAAPYSTLDLSLATGREIVIEERAADEVRSLGGRLVTPAGAPVYNPAFDVTPAKFIAAIITERGVFRPPYAASLAAAYRDA